jgi:hypothetical protein
VSLLAGRQRKTTRDAALGIPHPQALWFGRPDQGDFAPLLDRHHMVAAMKDNGYRMLSLFTHAVVHACDMPNLRAGPPLSRPLKIKGLRSGASLMPMRNDVGDEIPVTKSRQTDCIFVDVWTRLASIYQLH